MAEKDYLQDLYDKYNEFIVGEDVESTGKSIEVIPTGSLSLDISIGIGGIPRGRFTEIFGVESSGKTTLALCIAKSAMDMGLDVLYVEPESNLNLYFIKSILGTEDISKFTLVQPETQEQSLDICELGINSGKFGLVVLDSIGALAPQKEKDKELGEKNMALTSSAITQFLRRNAYKVNKTKTAFIFINQVRDNIGTYIKSLSTPGGHALRHFASVRISLSKGHDIEQNTEKIGILSTFVVKKNKLAPPFRSFTFPIIFGKGIDKIRDVIEIATMLGIIEKRGSHLYFMGESLGQGMAKSRLTLETNKELLDNIIKEVYNISNNGKEVLTTSGEITED